METHQTTLRRLHAAPNRPRARSSGRRRKRRHARLLLYIVVGVVHSTEGAISTYFPSNCYEVGGGNMGPLYFECVGCQYVEAFDCLKTLRKNTSKNVPTGCGMNVLTVQPDPTCCPVFEDPGSHRSLDSSTSAYPDALRCLEDVGCAGDKLHSDLVGECVFNQCSQEYSCVATYSGSTRLSPAFGVSVVLALVVATLPCAPPGFGLGG